jgi:ComF family protein
VKASIREIASAFWHLLYPQICSGCGIDLPATDSLLCVKCLHALPATHFECYEGNLVEKRFYGRLAVQHASAQFYFTKGSLMARLVHLVKYKSERDLGIQLGSIMGDMLKRSARFHADMLVPLPLHPFRERRRGFNQAELLCHGISKHLQIPIAGKVVARPLHTDTQTHKGRVERWQNIEGKFMLIDPQAVEGKHVLLVDDVITTGATLEACGSVLLKAEGCTLSIACLCHSFS